MAIQRRLQSYKSNQRPKLGVTASVRNRKVWEGDTGWNDRIISFDSNNLYPNLLEFYIKNSSYAMTVIRVLRSFLYANGFADLNLNNQIFYNELGLILSGKQLLKNVIDDYSIHQTFALHIKYNALGQPASIKPLPIKNCRLCKPVENEVKEIAYWDNWEAFQGNLFMLEPVFLPVFNPANIQAEFEACGGFENHKGQIYYYKSGLGRYELPIWDSITDEIQTDIEIKVFRKRLIQNNLNATHILALPYKADEAEKTKLTNQINNAQGSENAGSVIVIDGFNKETMPEMLKTDNTDHDKMYDLIDNATKNSIRRVVNVPPVLVGDLVAGKLGTSQEVTESEQMFEKNTNMFRIDIEEALYDVLSKFYIPYTNIKIQPRYGAS
jgi:hypothetical protein